MSEWRDQLRHRLEKNPAEMISVSRDDLGELLDFSDALDLVLTVTTEEGVEALNALFDRVGVVRGDDEMAGLLRLVAAGWATDREGSDDD